MILLIINHLLVQFQVLLFNTNNLTSVIFFAHSLNVQTVLFCPQIEPNQVLPLLVRLDLGIMAMMLNSPFPRAQRLEPRHQIILCHIQDTRFREVFFLLLFRDTVDVFCCPSRLGWCPHFIRSVLL